MTIEEKAKRYDEVSKEVKDFFESKRKICSDATKALEHLFPELKKSEDERTRKELIDAVQGLWDDDALPMSLSVKRKNEWLAWLEKQGEKVDAIENFDTEFEKQVSRLLASIINKDWEYTEGFVKWASNSLLGYAKHEIEKESEQKQSNKPQGKSALEAVKEEKVDNANKIKPKFKVGDWIVDKSGCTQQVFDFRGGIYTCTYNSFATDCESNYHIWTIKDAKDGDVLAIGSEYFLFKNKKDNTSPVVCISHCFCDSAGAFRVTNGRDCGEFLSIENGIKVCPATKGQRDLLEKAMTDAGYTFDFEKKELKRTTTPKSEVVDKIEPRFKVGDWVVANYSGKIGQVVAVSEDGYGYQLDDGLCFGVSWCDIFHLWSIKDARDGDVLASDGSVFIFQDEYMTGKPRAYCGIVDGGFYQGSGGCWTNEPCYPATKEQWDTLRSKMKKAGYEWDSENKKLIKI